MTRLSLATITAALMLCVSSGTTLAQTAAPARGEADLGVLAPATVVKDNMVVTTIKVKNLMTSNSIAGLKVEEYWYDRARNPVTGSKTRLTKPLQPGEVATLTLQTPKDPKMFQNQYVFSHANGKVKTKTMKAF